MLKIYRCISFAALIAFMSSLFKHDLEGIKYSIIFVGLLYATLKILDYTIEYK